ncbi:MAG TPA: hypothetical protein VGY55_01525 [Pirellulales bacterium]|jgi:hypothetical protein|nr:hypothetical protein [Pirellulales bacterium]
MKWIILLVGLAGFASGCSSTPTNGYGTTYAPPAYPAYAPGPVYPAAPVYQPQSCTCQPVAAAPATTTYRALTPTTYIQPASYSTPTTCCN